MHASHTKMATNSNYNYKATQIDSSSNYQLKDSAIDLGGQSWLSFSQRKSSHMNTVHNLRQSLYNFQNNHSDNSSFIDKTITTPTTTNRQSLNGTELERLLTILFDSCLELQYNNHQQPNKYTSKSNDSRLSLNLIDFVDREVDWNNINARNLFDHLFKYITKRPFGTYNSRLICKFIKTHLNGGQKILGSRSNQNKKANNPQHALKRIPITKLASENDDLFMQTQDYDTSSSSSVSYNSSLGDNFSGNQSSSDDCDIQQQQQHDNNPNCNINTDDVCSNSASSSVSDILSISTKEDLIQPTMDDRDSLDKLKLSNGDVQTKHRKSIESSIDYSSSYEADDEGFPTLITLPCHQTHENCHTIHHPHRASGKIDNRSSQIIKHSDVCKLLFEFMFDLLTSPITTKHQQNTHHKNNMNNNKNDTSLSSNDILTPILRIVERLNRLCLRNKYNSRCLFEQNFINLLLESLLKLVKHGVHKQEAYLEPLLRLALTIADFKIDGTHLRLILQLMKLEQVKLETVLACLEKLLDHQRRLGTNIKPYTSINFPTESLNLHEIENDTYLSNSWHFKIRKSVMNCAKDGDNQFIDGKSPPPRPPTPHQVAALRSTGSTTTNNKFNQKGSHAKGKQQHIGCSWSECSFMIPLSSVTPMFNGARSKVFSSSMWISLCGNLIFTEESNANSASFDTTSQHHNSNSYWLPSISRRTSKNKPLLKRRIRHRINIEDKKTDRPKGSSQLEEDDSDNLPYNNNEKSANSRFHQMGATNLYLYSMAPAPLPPQPLLAPSPAATGRRQMQSYPNGVTRNSTGVVPPTPPLLPGGMGDPPMEFFGRRTRHQSQKSLMHLVSFAIDTLTIEIWLNVRSFNFCVRACRLNNGSPTLLDEVSFPSHLQATGEWSHLCFQMEEITLSKNNRLNLKVIIDGCYEEEERLTYGLYSVPTNFACLVGCEKGFLGYVWKLSQVIVYKQFPSRDTCTFLLGKGPDFWCFTHFKENTASNISNGNNYQFSNGATVTLPDISQRSPGRLFHSANHQLLHSYYHLNEEASLRWLTQNVMAVFVAHRHEYFVDYSSNIMSSSLMSPLPHDFEYKNSSDRFIQARVLNFAKMDSFNHNDSIGPALVKVGGIDAMLVCFAEVIRRTGSSRAHELAFNVLLKISQTHQHHLYQFLDGLDGLNLINYLLCHPKCCISETILKAYMDYCLIRQGESTLIKSSKLLHFLLSAWRAWHRNLKVAQSLYEELIQLLDREDPYRKYNFKIMTDADCIDILLRALRESLVQPEDCVPPLDHETIVLMVDLISKLIKRPPGLPVINEIMEFLLLLHPAAESYVRYFSANTFLYPLKYQKSASSSSYIDWSSSTGSDLSTGYSDPGIYDDHDNVDDDDDDDDDDLGEDVNDRDGYRQRVSDSQEYEAFVVNSDGIQYNQAVGEQKQASNGLAGNVNSVIERIANMLASIVKMSPGQIIIEALANEIIRLDMLIILANNSSPEVRVTTLKLLFNCLRCCQSLGPTILENFQSKTKGFHLMAHQLLRYKTNSRMLELCYGIILEIDNFDSATMCLEFDVDDNASDGLKLSTWTIFLSIMTQCEKLNDVVLSLQFLNAYLSQAMIKQKTILQYLLENGLIHSVMKIFFDYMYDYINCIGTPAVSSALYRGRDSDQNGEKNSNIKSLLKNIVAEIDISLDLLTIYYFKQLTTQQALDNYRQLVDSLDLMAPYVPSKFKYLIRDRQIVSMRSALNQIASYKQRAEKIYISKLWRDVLGGLFGGKLDVPITPLQDYYRTNRYQQQTAGIEVYSDDKADAIMNNNSKEDKNLENNNKDTITVDKINQKDICERIKFIFDIIMEFIISRDITIRTSSTEKQFAMEVLETLLAYLAACCPVSSDPPNANNLNQFIVPNNQLPNKSSVDNDVDQARSSVDHCRTLWFKILSIIKLQLRDTFWKLIIYLMSPSESIATDERNYFTSKILQLDMNTLMNVLRSFNDTRNCRVLLVFIRDILATDASIKKVCYFEDLDINDDDTTTIDGDEQEDEDEFRQEIHNKLLILAEELELTLGLANNNQAQQQQQDTTHWRDEWFRSLSLQVNKHKDALNLFAAKLQTKLEQSLAPLISAASRVTQDINEINDKERKHYIHELKQNKAHDYFIRQRWQSLIVAQSHERAVWYSPTHYPQSWELDPTEGPDRIRRRLRPCHLNLASGYFRRAGRGQKLLDGEINHDRSSTTKNNGGGDTSFQYCGPHPLCSIFESQERSMDSNALKSRLFTTGRITFNCPCKIVTPSDVYDGELSLGSSCIHFIGQKHHNCDQPSSNRSVVTEDFWFDEIRELWCRRYQLQDVGLELFLTNNLTYLLAFETLKDREDFHQQLKQRQMANLTHYDQIVDLNRLTMLWRERKVTNFQYLTYLNKLAGRSFNDLMQYPVFPFILADYTSEILNLHQAATFRRLSAPIAIQNKDREQRFLENYDHLKGEYDRAINSEAQLNLCSNGVGLANGKWSSRIPTSVQITAIKESNKKDTTMTGQQQMTVGLRGVTKPYHYSSHYSNSATVLHFLVRLPPYTQMLIQYQDGNFDLPDRTFHSMATTWQLSSQDSATDFKESLPEFFFLPEMFCNFEQFDLGHRQNGDPVNDVELPPWCRNGDPRLFTLIHRQALESNYVSEHLHEWIDLIFGFKQTGQAAIDAINVFHPATYYGMIDFNQMNSQYNPSSSQEYPQNSTNSARNELELNRVALQTMIRTFGQMPKQLFMAPHKQRQAGPQLDYSFLQADVQSQSRSSSSGGGSGGSRAPVRQVLGEIVGLRWGSYVGSPSENDPIAIRQDELPHTPGVSWKLALLPSGDLVALKQNSSLILNQAIKHSWRGGRFTKPTTVTTKAPSSSFPLIMTRQQQKYHKTSDTMGIGSSKQQKFSFNSMSLINWSFLDGIIRIKHPAIGDKSSDPLIWADSIIDSITICQSMVELNLLIVGYKSGALCVHLIISLDIVHATSTTSTNTTCGSISQSASTTPDKSNIASQSDSIGGTVSSITSLSLADRMTSRWLHCHTGSITNIAINKSFGVIVTASQDGTCAVWDLNNLTYIRTIDYNRVSQSNSNKHHTNNNRRQSSARQMTMDAQQHHHTGQQSSNNNADNVTTTDTSSSGISSISLSLINNNNGHYPTTSKLQSDTLPDDGGSIGRITGDLVRRSIDLVTMSNTLGDIVAISNHSIPIPTTTATTTTTNFKQMMEHRFSASKQPPASIIYVHTINGVLVNSLRCQDKATAVCCSSAPEGISINVIGVGFQDGSIRLYSSWDLTKVKEIRISDYTTPITSLIYSMDNQYLFVVNQDGYLITLKNQRRSSSPIPRVIFV